MKKIITFLSLVGALLLVLDTVNAANSLLLFVFAGVVPGTDISIAPVDMMAAIATAFTIVIMRLTLWPRIRPALFSPTKATTSSRKRTARRTA
jgi:hypothetical protein